MKKSYIIIGIIIVVAAAIYFFTLGPAGGSDTLQVQNNPEAELAATRVLNLLKQIKSLKIDTALFASPAYQTLRDYEVAIPEQSVGRQNPFAPVGGFVVPVTPKK